MDAELPEPRPHGVSDRQAVSLCREWMIYLGASDTVEAVGPVRDICDLYSRRYLAWVDNRRENLEPVGVWKAARTASADGRQALIFNRSGVRPEAQRQADALGVALLSFVAVDGLLEGANSLGDQLRATGFRS